jgi:hypothetical protein
MRDVQNRLQDLGRVKPSQRLDAAIADLIDGAERGVSMRPRHRWLPVAAAAGGLAAVLAVALRLVIGGGPESTPPDLVIELPVTPALERLLVHEPPGVVPFASQQIADLEPVYLAGTPSERLTESH